MVPIRYLVVFILLANVSLATELHDHTWTIEKQDYLQENMDYWFEYINQTTYRLHYKVINITKYDDKEISKYKDKEKAIKDIKDTKTKGFPSLVLDGDVIIKESINPFTKPKGYIDLQFPRGVYNTEYAIIKIGYESMVAVFTNGKASEVLTMWKAYGYRLPNYRYASVPRYSNITGATIKIKGVSSRYAVYNETDYFTDNSINTSKWTVWANPSGSTISETSGWMQMQSEYTAGTYDSSAYIIANVTDKYTYYGMNSSQLIYYEFSASCSSGTNEQAKIALYISNSTHQIKLGDEGVHCIYPGSTSQSSTGQRLYKVSINSTTGYAEVINASNNKPRYPKVNISSIKNKWMLKTVTMINNTHNVPSSITAYIYETGYSTIKSEYGPYVPREATPNGTKIIVGGKQAYYNANTLSTEVQLNIKQNVTDALNAGACNCVGCEPISAYYCNIPFNFYTRTGGMLNYSDLEINYTLTSRLTNCTTGYPALHFFMRDEDTLSLMNATISADFYYTQAGESNILSIDLTNKKNFSVCVTPNGTQFTGNFTILYHHLSDYPQRRYEQLSYTYTNATNNIDLYLLNISDGYTYARFAIEDTYSNPLNGVTCKAASVLNGTLKTIEQQTSDDSGMCAFILDPYKDYSMTFSKTGYSTASYSIRPVSNEIITITLSKYASYDQPYGVGLSFDRLPFTNHLNNNTKYNLSINMTSSYWVITACNLTLYNSTALLDSKTATFSSAYCNATIEYDTDNQRSITAKLYYQLNSSYNGSYSVPYSIDYEYTGGYSLKVLLTDIQNLSDSGFNDFTRMIIGFLFIFLVVAAISEAAGGIKEPEPIIIMVIVLTYMVSYLGWFTLTFEGMPNILSLRKYFIFYLVLLAGGSYLIEKLR